MNENKEFKFKKLEGKTTISILPNNIEPPFMHYAPQDAFVSHQTLCILCWTEKEQTRAIARLFGPKPRIKHKERKPPKQY